MYVNTHDYLTFICEAGLQASLSLLLFWDEISLQLEYESLKAHPNLVKVIGFCYESDKHVGFVYDLSPLDTVRKLLPRGIL